ncbi:MAG: hypothetical protein IKR25_08965 [Muribaculaceae bacterium]|nr:hypothetical protein [Muribaculaceae bacterium]
MNVNRDDIDALLHLVELKLGRSLVTPYDFDMLTAAVAKKTGTSISRSTVKRLVGYVGDKHEPSPTTLNTLARYAGYRDWSAFLSRGSDPTSGTLNDELVQTAQLTVGDRIELEWLPDRHCVLRYLGEIRFEVEQVTGSHSLASGDTLNVMVFCLGQPLQATNHHHGGTIHPLYIAASQHGLTALHLIKADKTP